MAKEEKARRLGRWPLAFATVVVLGLAFAVFDAAEAMSKRQAAEAVAKEKRIEAEAKRDVASMVQSAALSECFTRRYGRDLAQAGLLTVSPVVSKPRCRWHREVGNLFDSGTKELVCGSEFAHRSTYRDDWKGGEWTRSQSHDDGLWLRMRYGEAAIGAYKIEASPTTVRGSYVVSIEPAAMQHASAGRTCEAFAPIVEALAYSSIAAR